MCVCVHCMKHFEISLTLQCDWTVAIISVKFETNL